MSILSMLKIVHCSKFKHWCSYANPASMYNICAAIQLLNHIITNQQTFICLLFLRADNSAQQLLADCCRPVPHCRRESRRRRRHKLKLLRFSAFPLFHDLPGLKVKFAFLLFSCSAFKSISDLYYGCSIIIVFHCSIKAFQTFFS